MLSSVFGIWLNVHSSKRIFHYEIFGYFENKSGETIFMIAQSYMPAQETQILKNKNDDKFSPWYSANIEDKLYTPEWTFGVGNLKTW